MVEKQKKILTEPANSRREEYSHQEIEGKWAYRWFSDKLYKTDDSSGKPKFYALDMFPYPSGTGLHVGHVEGYTATDIVSRFKRMQGFEVLHPMGWDAFGLPTENFAIKTGTHPKTITTQNTDAFREQCIRTGFSIDWDREIDTSSPEYYKWTQQLFLFLFKKGLAYKAKSPVNWCLGCQTVIANEQIQQGHCERCESNVELRNIEQWFFKITDYANRLLQDIDDLNWPEPSKERQRNWIGRTEGIEIQMGLTNTQGNLLLFTTEPELLGASSKIVIAPEHPDIERIVSEQQKPEVLRYMSAMTPQSERERKKTRQRNKGVFSGNYVINPVTGKHMEIWISEHIFMDEYGGVAIEKPDNPLHDQHAPEDREMIMAKLGDLAKSAVRYKLRDWLISRERYWGAPIPIVHCATCGDQPVPEDQLPVLLPAMNDFTPTGIPPLAKSYDFMNTSCPHCGGVAKREAKTLDTFVDSSWYYLRFADPHNNNGLANRNLLSKWLPVDAYMGGAEHVTGHLLYARFITKVLYDLGEIDFEEPFAQLIHQGLIIGADGRKMSKRWGNVINPNDISKEFGSDTLRIYEMFLGPIDQTKKWNTKAIIGSRRFIDRIWQLQMKVQDEIDPMELVETNSLIDNISRAIQSYKFNIAISSFMKYINFIDKAGKISRKSYETLLKLLAPFAPFITEELWERAGNKYSIHLSSWPEATKQDAKDPYIIIPIMINGKVIGTFSEPAGVELAETDILDMLRRDAQLSYRFIDLNVSKIIYKPGKIFNIVV